MEIQEGRFIHRQNGRKLSAYNLFISTFCFLTSGITFTVLFFLPPTDRVCISRSVVYKRVAEAINYEWVNFGDYYFPPSVYKSSGPEQDSAWNELMSHDTVSISESEMSALQLSKDASWKQFADGERAAVVGAHYEMNCLNLLRHHVYMEIESSAHNALRRDVDQCLELLRNQLMCSGDVTPFLELSVPTLAGSKPDLETMHKCRRYEDLKDWAKKHSKGSFYAKWDPSR